MTGKWKGEKKKPQKTRTCRSYRPDLPSEFPNLLFTSHLRPDVKSRAEIVDGMSGKPSVSPRHVSERGKLYFRKPWNLASHQDPVSAAVCWSNCTVMAFYVALLRWLIIYTLHTLSSCSSDSRQINDRHDGKVLTRRSRTFQRSERKNTWKEVRSRLQTRTWG